MVREAVFRVKGAEAKRIAVVPLADSGLFERQHLQEWVIANPAVLGDDVMILTAEYDQWQTAAGERRSDRLDVLGIDADGRLVVVELKRDMADRSVELQVLKYAALVSRFTAETLVEAHSAFRAKRNPSVSESAESAIAAHITGELEAESFTQPRMVIMASSFPETVTNTVVWLTENGLDITLIQYQLYGAEPDPVLVVSQLWPPLEAGDFVLKPRRTEARVVAARTAESRRQRDAVAILIESDALDPGSELTIEPDGINEALRESVNVWLAADPARGRASWTGERSGPIRWEADGSADSPSRLAKRILQEATGEDRALRGTLWFRTPDGLNLTQVAEQYGLLGPGGRDWSDLHAILDGLPSGRWTTYGDLASAIVSAAQPVGNHLSQCEECAHAHRVLRSDGAVAERFTWSDPEETRTPQQMLEAEGISFDAANRADPAKRLSVPELKVLSA